MKTKGIEITSTMIDPWFKKLMPGFKQHKNDKEQWITEYETVCIDVPIYLSFLASIFTQLGGRLSVRTIKDIRELWADAKPADIVVNCSGIGARLLGGVMDTAMYPTRGQTVLVHAPHIKHTIYTKIDDKLAYIIPRIGGTCVLGGTFQADDWNMQVDQKTRFALFFIVEAMK